VLQPAIAVDEAGGLACVAKGWLVARIVFEIRALTRLRVGLPKRGVRTLFSRLVKSVGARDVGLNNSITVPTSCSRKSLYGDYLVAQSSRTVNAPRLIRLRAVERSKACDVTDVASNE